jgi:hypothetical protein
MVDTQTGEQIGPEVVSDDNEMAVFQLGVMYGGQQNNTTPARGFLMNHHQISALIGAYNELQRMINAIGSGEIVRMHGARQYACGSLVELARQFPNLFNAVTFQEARQLLNSIVFAERPKASGAAEGKIATKPRTPKAATAD